MSTPGGEPSEVGAEEEPEFIFVGCHECRAVNELKIDGEGEPEARECTRCGSRLRLTQDRLLRTVQPAALYDEKTGIRHRIRRKLGFRKPIVEFAVDHDMSLPADGERIRELIVAWHLENGVPWDTETEREPGASLLQKVLIRGGLGVGVVAVAVGLWYTTRQAKQGSELAVPAPLLDEEALTFREQFEATLDDRYAAAERAAREFLAVTNPEELRTLIRDSQRVMPLGRSRVGG